MIGPVATSAASALKQAAPAAVRSSADSADTQLRESAKALEGLFVQQLFKAMRETVPQQEGIVSGGAGEDIFTSLMDQHLAAETPSHWAGGLGEALYRQLRGALPPAAPQASTPDPVATAS